MVLTFQNNVTLTLVDSNQTKYIQSANLFFDINFFLALVSLSTCSTTFFRVECMSLKQGFTQKSHLVFLCKLQILVVKLGSKFTICATLHFFRQKTAGNAFTTFKSWRLLPLKCHIFRALHATSANTQSSSSFQPTVYSYMQTDAK